MNGDPGKRMLSLAIGVSSADPLPYLRGAINGAHDFHHWAQSVGYQSELLTDEDPLQPVTIERLRAKLLSMLNESAIPIYRLILYFAGHGLIREAEEGLWLLSDWSQELRAVAVEVLKRRLYMYGVSQISIFADACRSLPGDMNAADLTPDAVLGKGPVKSNTTPYIDKFIAAQDGTTAFMVPGDSPAQDRCLFTGVLMEGLWGSPSAISKFFPGKVTSQSLAEYLRQEVPKRADSYKRKLNPTVQPLFPLGSDIYFGEENPAPVPPIFAPWPDPNQVLGMGPAETPRAAPGGFPEFIGGVLGAITSPVAGFAAITTPSFSEFFKSGGSGKPAAPAPKPKPDPGEVLQQRLNAQQVPTHFETGAGFAVEGADIAAVWTVPGRTAGVGGRRDWWHVGESNPGWLASPSPVLIELANGQFLGLTALPYFIGAVVCNERGAQALVYREIYTDKSMGELAARAITQMESGSLRADSVPDLAIELRQSKFADPMMGVISAYLYDSISDIENIRRMAFYYIQNGQSIPYDIALLAQVEGSRGATGLLQVTIPAVPARAARTEAEQRHTWTWTATPEASGTVGGFWPWMRQGWSFLDEPADVEAGLIDPAIAALRRQLTPARFTTFNAQGGQQLVNYLGFIANWP